MEKLNFRIGDLVEPCQAMRFALKLASKGFGRVSPNPPVGCVLVDCNHVIIGYGYHESYGEAHAEVNAVESVIDRNKLRGSTAYVTLEPCGHHGKTPPCADLLIDSQIERVVYAVSDPSPAHSSIARLKSAGIKVEKNDFGLHKKIRSLLDKFLFESSHKETYVTLKCATSIDGFIALKNGQSKWLSGEESRHFAHLLRNQHDAIIIGVNTLLEDNPSLNVRLEGVKRINKPKVIIVDPKLKSLDFFKRSQLKNIHNDSDIYFATHTKNKSVNCISVNKNSMGKLDLNDLLKKMYSLGINSVLVEGGGATLSSFVSQETFHCLRNFITPSIIGAEEGVSWTALHSTKDLQSKLTLSDADVKIIGNDVLYTGFKL